MRGRRESTESERARRVEVERILMGFGEVSQFLETEGYW
jgi:hypothetical protein